MTSVLLEIPFLILYTISSAFNLITVKRYDTISALTIKKIGGNQELCQIDEIWFA